tara:strand:- start:1723 stop:1986 length:264 start_codon:yes stop_codon:yes gene_type:complete
MPAITSKNPMKPLLVAVYREKFGEKARINGLGYNKKENFYYADILMYAGNRRYNVIKRLAKLPFNEFNNFLTHTTEKWRLEGVKFRG